MAKFSENGTLGVCLLCSPFRLRKKGCDLSDAVTFVSTEVRQKQMICACFHSLIGKYFSARRKSRSCSLNVRNAIRKNACCHDGAELCFVGQIMHIFYCKCKAKLIHLELNEYSTRDK